MAQQNNQPVYKYIIVSAISFLIIFVVGFLAFIFSVWKIQHANAGRELSQTIENEKLKLEASVDSEIALVLKMADSPLVRRYFLNPHDPNLERIAVEELTDTNGSCRPNQFFG